MNVFFFFNNAFILKAGAKVSIFFFLASFFENIFNLFSQQLGFPKISMNSLLRGANIKTKSLQIQMFFALF